MFVTHQLPPEAELQPFTGSMRNPDGSLSYAGALYISHLKVQADVSSGPESELWGVYGSTIDAYQTNSFLRITGTESLSRRIGRDAVEADTEPFVVVDLMASTAGLRTLATIVKQEFGSPIRGVAVSLTDDRSVSTKQLDSELGISHIAGDLGRSPTWRDLRLELGSQKVDYLLSAGVGGLNNLPKHRMYYAGVLRRMWRMLNPDGGTMILEIPSESELSYVGAPSIFESMYVWLEKGICAVAIDGLDNSALYIEREPGNPDELPVLS